MSAVFFCKVSGQRIAAPGVHEDVDAKVMPDEPRQKAMSEGDEPVAEKPKRAPKAPKGDEPVAEKPKADAKSDKGDEKPEAPKGEKPEGADKK